MNEKEKELSELLNLKKKLEAHLEQVKHTIRKKIHEKSKH
jgi:hypothetical protein